MKFVSFQSTRVVLLMVLIVQKFGSPVTAWMMMDRRGCCLQMLQLLQFLELPNTVPAPLSSSVPSFPDAEITDKVFMDVRVSRQDGSFYVRDDLPDTFENRVLKARLVFGLYGTVAPNHVERFLRFMTPPDSDDGNNNPMPSYGRSTFLSLDQSTGLLQGGYIPSLRLSEVGGSTVLQYGTRVLPATLWIDRTTNKLSHSCKGLLTHRTLDATPTFGITTRACPSLDSTHTVFGQLMWNEEMAQFIEDVQDLPTYSIERPTSYDDSTTGVATTVFNAQREFFRGAAKTFGDARVDKVYEGKLLRRMEVTQVGRL